MEVILPLPHAWPTPLLVDDPPPCPLASAPLVAVFEGLGCNQWPLVDDGASQPYNRIHPFRKHKAINQAVRQREHIPKGDKRQLLFSPPSKFIVFLVPLLLGLLVHSGIFMAYKLGHLLASLSIGNDGS